MIFYLESIYNKLGIIMIGFLSFANDVVGIVFSGFTCSFDSLPVDVITSLRKWLVGGFDSCASS